MAGHGRDIAADEKSHAGSVSLQTFSENITHYQMQAPTTMGTMGVKVWISRFEKAKIIPTDRRTRAKGDDHRHRKPFDKNDRIKKNNIAGAA